MSEKTEESHRQRKAKTIRKGRDSDKAGCEEIISQSWRQKGRRKKACTQTNQEIQLGPTEQIQARLEPTTIMRGCRRRPYGALMHAVIRMLAAAVALAMSTGAAFAVMGKTTTDVALRTAPAAQAELIFIFPKARW